MKSTLILVVGMLIGAAALGAVLAAHHGDVTVRATLVRHDDGRVEVGLQQQGADGAWHSLDGPEARFLAPDAEVGTTYHSSEVVIPVETQQEQATVAYADYLHQSGVDIGVVFNEYFAEYYPDEEVGTLLCVTDANDPGIGALCQGAEETYAGEIEHLDASDYGVLRETLTARFTDAPPAAVFTTSVQTTLLGLEVEEATGQWLPWIYWIELVDQHPAGGDTLFCQITHSGHVIAEEEEGDLFWGLASEVSTAAAGQMGVRFDFSAHAIAADQADAIRDCIADNAAVIATTLAEPDLLAPAIGEALDADIPVLSFNSGGGYIAAETGTALHIALDDHEAGRMAGEEFNHREVEGAVLCIIHEPNNVGLHHRCTGFEETYSGTVERWSAEDPEESVRELIARMAEGDLSAVLALSTDSAYEARVARYYSEVELDIAAFGFSVSLLRAVIDGGVMFTIIDHPEMQTYLSAVASVIAERWRLDPVAYFNGMSLLIEPQIADAEYMQTLADSMFAE